MAHATLADEIRQTAPVATPPNQTVRRVSAPAWGCLILSEDAQRRRSFAISTESAGWRPHLCGSVGEALRVMQRQATQLAIVDLGAQSAIHKSTFLQAAGQMASPQRLLLVCDEPDDETPGAELSARQAGAWLYVPSPVFDDELTDLFRSARQVAEKISDAPGSA